MAVYYQSNSLIITAISGELFEIAPHLWQENQQQHSILLHYLALPLKRNDSTLWLAVDSLSNLAACETFAFLTGKIEESVLVESHQLKQALQQLSSQISQVQEANHLLYQAETTIEPSADGEQSDEPMSR